VFPTKTLTIIFFIFFFQVIFPQLSSCPPRWPPTRSSDERSHLHLFYLALDSLFFFPPVVLPWHCFLRVAGTIFTRLSFRRLFFVVRAGRRPDFCSPSRWDQSVCSPPLGRPLASKYFLEIGFYFGSSIFPSSSLLGDGPPFFSTFHFLNLLSNCAVVFFTWFTHLSLRNGFPLFLAHACLPLFCLPAIFPPPP